MSDIQPGDVVVCVDAGPFRNPQFSGTPVPLVLNRVYRVDERRHLIISVGIKGHAFHVDRFRKIEPGKMEFVGLTEREREDA